ncbi:hypothetical protein ACFRCG_12980 [Embleya sp. NPDC056575]|uniref:hypothetical protein n=1 Tax=unclassified Embleya TaxID=2699296 RepID=UPI00369C8BD6
MYVRRFAVVSALALAAASAALPGQASAGEAAKNAPVTVAATIHASSEFTNQSFSGAQWDATLDNVSCNAGYVIKQNANVPAYVDDNIESHQTWSYCQSNHFDGVWHAGAASGWWGGAQSSLGGMNNYTSSIAYR